jgi:Sec-independent protein translocase protein TatA
VFEGLLAPWHLAILAVVVLLVLGPHKLADRWHDIGETLRHLGEGPTDDHPEDVAEPPEPSRSLAFRIGRRVHRRREE